MATPRRRGRLPQATLFLLLLSWPGSDATAQVNIEQFRSGADSTQGFSASIGLDLASRQGNVNVHRIGLQGRTDYAGPVNAAFLLLQGRLGWQDGKQFRDEGLVHVRYLRRMRGRVSPEVFAQIDFDTPRRLSFRTIVGGGLRIELLRGDRVRASWGTDYMLEHERLDVTNDPVQDARVTVHRWANYLTTAVDFNERAGGTWTLYLQPRFDAVEDVRILSEAGLATEIVGPLSLELVFRFRYDSRPPTGTKSLDTELTSGVTVRF